MKKLFENFRQFSFRENAIQDNTKALIDLSTPGEIEDNFIDFFGLNGVDQNFVKNLVSQISPLKTNKIVKALGSGTFGVVYQLDNDHVLKLFQGGVGSAEEDLEKFKNMHDRQFQGKSNKHEPAIYDLGKAEWADDETGEVVEVFYVEMGKVIPFNIWIKQTNQQQNEYDYKIFLNAIGNFLELDNLGISNFLEWIKREPATSKSVSKLPPKIVRSLFSSVVKYKKLGNRVDDLHAGNLGVIPSNDPRTPDIFVFFDI